MARTIAVLAVQGAFIEHETKLRKLGAHVVELRQASDLKQTFDGLVLPGGESTTQAKLLHELGMFSALKERIEKGLPTLATCAGLILLAREVVEKNGVEPLNSACANKLQLVHGFSTLDVTVERNAYGRQLASFHTEEQWAKNAHAIAEIPSDNTPLPLTFIRAPRITKMGAEAHTLIEHDGYPVAVLQGKQLALAFHPELDADMRFHELFLSL